MPAASVRAPVVAEVEGQLAGARRGPVELRAPFARRLEAVDDRLLVVLHVDDDGRLVHDPGARALAPVVEPAHHLVQVVDARAGNGHVRDGVVPGADQHLLRHVERLVEAQRRVRIAVAPAADHEDRAGDPVCDVAHRAVPPVGAVGLVLEPLEEVGLVVGDVLLPERRPVAAGPLGVGREGVVGDHEVAVVADVVVLAQVAAAVVAVVRVAVVGEVHGDDARQVRRLVRRHLERREAAVGDPHLVDVAVAEGLRREPLDRVVAVELLLQDVLVDVDASGAAGAADVDAGDDVAVAGEVAVEARARNDLVLAVRDVLHDHRQRLARVGVGHVEVGREPNAVPHRDENVLHDPDALCSHHVELLLSSETTIVPSSGSSGSQCSASQSL